MADWEMPPDDSESFTPAPPVVAEAPPQGSAPAGEEQTPIEGAETEAAGTPVPASETSRPASEVAPAPEEEMSGDVKRQARKYWAAVNEMGGEPVFEAARKLATTYLRPGAEAAAEFKETLKQTSPNQYWSVRDQIVHETLREQPDAVLQAMFGEGVTRAQIEQALRGPQSPSEWYEQTDPSDPQSPTYDPLKDPNLSDAVKARIRKADELEKRIAPLEQTVKSFNEMTETQKAQQVEALRQEFLGEALKPVGEMIRDAGLVVLDNDPDDVKAEKLYAQKAIVRDVLHDLENLPENAPIYKEVEGFITAGDRTSAWYKIEQARARAETSAARHVRYHSGKQVQLRDSRTKPLTRGTPKLVPEAAPAGITTTPRPGPAFDADQHAAALADIKARVS